MQGISIVLSGSIKGLLYNKVTKVIALLCIIIPCIFVYITLAVNWSFIYTTAEVNIAIVNNDKGIIIDGNKENLGSRVAELVGEKSSNSEINWILVSSDEAKEGMITGKYYGMMIIPEDFSEGIKSITTDTPNMPRIVYSMNLRQNIPISTSRGIKVIQIQVLMIEDIIKATSNVAKEVFGNVNLKIFKNKNKISNLVTSIMDLDNNREYYMEKILEYKSITADMIITLSDLKVRFPNLEQYIEGVFKTNEDIEELLNRVNKFEEEYQGLFEGSTSEESEKVIQRVEQVRKLALYIDQDIYNLQTMLADTIKAIKDVYIVFNEADQSIVAVTQDLYELGEKLNFLASDQDVSTLIYMLENYPDLVAEYLEAPTLVERIGILDIYHYLSLVTPYVMAIAMNLGGMLLLSVFSLKIKTTNAILQETSLFQVYLGRWLFFVLFGIVQVIVIFIQVKWGMNINLTNAVTFLIVLLMGEVTYISVIYALESVFGKFGRYINYYFLMIQVILLGEMFSAQHVPTTFRILNNNYPFIYVVNCMRKVQVGIDGANIIVDILIMIVYIGVSLVLGIMGVIVLKPKIEKLRKTFKESYLARDDE